MKDESNSNVTVVQFVTTLINNSTCNPKTADYMSYGYQTGWLKDMDVTGKDEPLLKKNAARIVHEFMRIELQEPDLADVSCASKLRDLYDCRVCAKHIMQVTAKGIMKGYHITDTLYLFGLNDNITHDEMGEIINRIFHPAFRINV